MKDKAIWIDKEKAHILTMIGEEVQMKTLESGLREPEVETDRQGGATEVLKDRKVLEREKHRTKLFFDAIASQLKNAKRIVIIGPAQMGHQLSKYLNESYAEIGSRVLEEIKSHKVTNNQLKAMVREYYLPNP